MKTVFQANKKYHNRLGVLISTRTSPYPAGFRQIALASSNLNGEVLYYNSAGQVIAYEDTEQGELRFVQDHTHWADLDLVGETPEGSPVAKAVVEFVDIPA